MRQETIFHAHKAYTKENTIQIWSGKHGKKDRATRDASSDVRCNEMREQREKGTLNKIKKNVEPSSSYEREHRIQITKNQILKTKTSRDYRRKANDEEDNIKEN